ncbi:gamma-butyrobetaine hydroxylase-like domain-containing protein [Pseudomonas akapageensis]|uniref:gamma-butyrobetaine hydroxylase-like domain-containing protein n=1 Tax=Pseudomonas akapageensis TaxID=2609961 RepID=UPI00140B511C
MTSPRAIGNARSRGELRLEWADGSVQLLSHGRLRSSCPCAQCRAARLCGRIDLVDQDVRLVELNPQGYGVQLIFDDGHDQGIYPWAYLRTLAG